jgi:diguanylate cyclase (GGDEF)-like protein/PAS domain S-box-containing protein
MENWAIPPVRSTWAAFRTGEWLGILIWPVLGLLLAAFLWQGVGSRMADIEEEGEALMRNRAAATANSYAQQIRHMVEQIDQILLRLKYQWEEQETLVNLEKERLQGLFPHSTMLDASIYDANGNLVTTTYPGTPVSTDASRLPYFQKQAGECCRGLDISMVGNSNLHGRPVVRFSRRLTQFDGSLAGVAVVSVEPSYLVTFQENAATGEHDFVTLRLQSGPVLASRVGEQTQDVPIFYRRNPIFPSPQGVIMEPAEKFRDDRTRFIAWRKLQNYPLVALAGISVEDAMVPFVTRAEAMRQTAVAQTFLILLFAFGAAYLSAKLAFRRRHAEETQATYRLATDAANEGFYMLRPLHDRHGELTDFCLEDCNNRAAELTGMTRDEMIGKNGSNWKPDGFAEEILSLCRVVYKKGVIEEEVRVPPDSPLRAQWIYRRMVKSSAGLALTIRDISEEKAQEQALADLANNDTLTKLPNRNWLNSFLPVALRDAASSTSRLAVLFIDLDNFKNVNDTLGHDAGDELLKQAAVRLKDTVRASDHVARLGGDEFVIILEQVEVEEDVARVAKAIIHTISKPFTLSAGIGNAINASIGISLFPQDGNNAETLLKHADIAMYAAKAAGKGRYAFYHTHLSDSLLLRLSKERALQEAVEKQEFVVYYQPRVGADNGRLTSMEALVRWERPGHGLVYPSEFIDMAEDGGLIVRIGEIVIDMVCAQLALWKREGVQLVPVSINVSPQQLKSGTLSAFFIASLRHYGIDSSLIEAELTESAVIDRSTVVTGELAALRAMGIKLMIDDFGSGYSSMAQLHRLDVDVLKVDSGFTKALSDGHEGKQLFRAIMSMANALDMCVVAEGVETVEEVSELQSLSCDEIQGYIVSEAVVASEMTKMMLKRFLFSPPLNTVKLAPA